MAYDLEGVRDRVRNRLDDDDFEQEYLDRAINYAQREITNKNKLNFLEATTTLTLNEGDYLISLPTDFHEYLFLRLLTPAELRSDLTKRYVDYEDFVATYVDPSLNTPSQPYYWSDYAQQITLSAPADQDYTFRLDYQRASATLTDDTDIPDLPEEFGELLEIGAYMRIAKREDDYDVKSQEERDYTRLLTDLKSVYGRKKGPGGLRRMRVA
jgi:hypothetical protein